MQIISHLCKIYCWGKVYTWPGSKEHGGPTILLVYCVAVAAAVAIMAIFGGGRIFGSMLIRFSQNLVNIFCL